eukprot:m.230244 g.230244  ORF g.230244 m.230244 type:complete len:297 (+) comp18858_c1_seq2:934-1824(+)
MLSSEDEEDEVVILTQCGTTGDTGAVISSSASVRRADKRPNANDSVSAPLVQDAPLPGRVVDAPEPLLTDAQGGKASSRRSEGNDSGFGSDLGTAPERSVFDKVAHGKDDLTAIVKCGPKAILEGMTAHPGSLGVQSLGCEGLVLLASESDEHRQVIVDNDGIDIVLAAMNTHAATATVSQFGCWLLYFLACLGANTRQRLVEANAVEAIVAVLSKHPYVAEVQEHGCWALDILARGVGDNKRLICDVSPCGVLFLSCLRFQLPLFCCFFLNFSCRCLGELARSYQCNVLKGTVFF